VADAVVVEPVSTPKFPANREINREFCRIRPVCDILEADTRANSKTCSEIPYATEQRIISLEQGILAQEQGISSSQNEIIGMRFSVHTAAHRAAGSARRRSGGFDSGLAGRTGGVRVGQLLVMLIVPPIVGLITYAVFRLVLERKEEDGDDIALQRRRDTELPH
jgi:hypothetical protein